MVEVIEENSSTCGRMLQGIKRLTWEVLKESLNVEEHARFNGNLWFSCDNFIKGIDCCLVCLNHTYLITTNQPQVAFITTTYVIHGDDVRLDHYLVYTKVEVCQVIL